MMQKQCRVTAERWGTTDGHEVFLFRLSNGDIDVEISNYGATVVSINVPDRLGIRDNIVAGFNNLKPYLGEHPYLGCIIGRYANRIAYGSFTLDSVNYSLVKNDGLNHLHGGSCGFNRKVWQEEKRIQTDTEAGIELSYLSADGEEGYPGNLKVKVRYILSISNKLHIQYEAFTDKRTVFNPTNHSYFNLTAFQEPTIHNHFLQVYADSYIVKNENNVPSGEFAPVEGTALDFREPKRLGTDILKMTADRGYDHNFVIRKGGALPSPATLLYDEHSGRGLKVYTDRPGIQLYTSNWWDGTLTGSQGVYYEKHGAVALETQSFPDSPNHSHFPSTVLSPGEVYQSETIYEFYVR